LWLLIYKNQQRLWSQEKITTIYTALPEDNIHIVIFCIKIVWWTNEKLPSLLRFLSPQKEPLCCSYIGVISITNALNGRAVSVWPVLSKGRTPNKTDSCPAIG